MKLNLSAIAATMTSLALLLGTADTARAGRVYLEVTSENIPLSPNGSELAEVELLSIRVPAGKWIVTAKANPVNFGAHDFVRCRIVEGNIQKDWAATMVGDGSPAVASIALQTALSMKSAQTVSLRCFHDFAIEGQYIDSGASLMIVQH